MTDASPFLDTTDMSSVDRFEDSNIWLPRLIFDAMKSGKSLIEGKTFVNCHIEGPAVVLATSGVHFDGCNMGPSGGDVRNLLFRPVGPEKVIGAIALKDCKFERCRFFAVGFTGPQSFIDQFLKVLGAPPDIGGTMQ